MTRLRIVSSDMPGWERRRRGRGFSYLDRGSPVGAADRDRCVALAIPPAWTNVWICPIENGHLQAVGTDDAGRRQYLYHPQWRQVRDRKKFDYILTFAQELPAARTRVRRQLRSSKTPATRVCALAFMLLDLGAFRIGTPRYTDQNGSYGLLTLERRHVRVENADVTFTYRAKSGQLRELTTRDAVIANRVRELCHYPGSSADRLFAYHDGAQRKDLTSEELATYLKAHLDDRATAKDFRTWQANVVAAAALATRQVDSAAARKTALAAAMREVATHLGNTPAVARSSYVDPRLIDLYRHNRCIDSRLADRYFPVPGQAMSPRLEKAVLQLLRE